MYEQNSGVYLCVSASTPMDGPGSSDTTLPVSQTNTLDG